MRNSTRRMGSAFLALALAFGMSVQTFAAEIPTRAGSANVPAAASENEDVKNFVVNVDTDSGCTSNLELYIAKMGEAKIVTISPLRNRNISAIYIVAGNEAAQINYDTESVKLNGQTYKIERATNGAVTINIPAITNDVQITAYSADERIVWVNETANVKSTETGMNIVPGDDIFAVKFSPMEDTRIKTITAVTSKGVYTADASDANIVIEGVYYRLFHDANGDVTVQMPSVPVNMTFTATANATRHQVVVHTDGGVKANVLSTSINDREDANIILSPASDQYVIKSLQIEYKGSIYNAGVLEDNDIRVGSIFWEVEVRNDGTVILYLTDVEDDVSITAKSNFKATAKYDISTWSDGHSRISYTGRSPFYEGASTTVTVRASSPYVLDSVRFAMNGDVATISPFTQSFVLDGKKLYVNWTNNREMSVAFDSLTDDLSITSLSTKGDLKTPSDKDIVDTPYTDYIGAYHPAFMKGYGNGFFGVDSVLTRAEAITLLDRAFLGMTDAALRTYAPYRYYADVNVDSWYAGPINYAAKNGYLDFLTGDTVRIDPNTPITRAEFLVLLINMKGDKVNAVDFNDTFSDVSRNHWAAKYISYATQQGWIKGIGGGLFAPDRSITRGEICAMMNRVLNRTCDYTLAVQVGPRFNDVPITHWAFYDVFEASSDHTASSSNGIETWGR